MPLKSGRCCNNTNLIARPLVLRQRRFASMAAAASTSSRGPLPEVVITRRLPAEALSLISSHCKVAHYWDKDDEAIPRHLLLDWVQNSQGMSSLTHSSYVLLGVVCHCGVVSLMDHCRCVLLADR